MAFDISYLTLPDNMQLLRLLLSNKQITKNLFILQTGIHTFFAILVNAFANKSTSVSPAGSTGPKAPQINSDQEVKIAHGDLMAGEHV